jgi:hypothetical protein
VHQVEPLLLQFVSADHYDLEVFLFRELFRDPSEVLRVSFGVSSAVSPFPSLVPGLSEGDERSGVGGGLDEGDGGRSVGLGLPPEDIGGGEEISHISQVVTGFGTFFGDSDDHISRDGGGGGLVLGEEDGLVFAIYMGGLIGFDEGPTDLFRD